VAHDRLVADFEALECIRVRRQQRQQFGAVKDHLDDISGALAAEEAMERYMSKMPAAEQAREKVSACWRALSEHEHFCKLTTPEKLQMINHRPLEPVAIHLMIEDCHRRFRDDRIVDDLIELLRNHV
ncbi:unnamed protein product, partial [Ascophyllum nodosum]